MRGVEGRRAADHRVQHRLFHVAVAHCLLTDQRRGDGRGRRDQHVNFLQHDTHRRGQRVAVAQAQHECRGIRPRAAQDGAQVGAKILRSLRDRPGVNLLRFGQHKTEDSPYAFKHTVNVDLANLRAQVPQLGDGRLHRRGDLVLQLVKEIVPRHAYAQAPDTRIDTGGHVLHRQRAGSWGRRDRNPPWH